MSSVSTGPNLIRNGSFEEDNTRPKSQVYKEGAKNIPWWQIAKGSVKWIGEAWNHADGSASLALAL